MNIPRISYSGYTTGTVGATSVIMITLRNSSPSTTTQSWSISVGTGNVVSSYASGDMFTVICEVGTFRVNVTLTNDSLSTTCVLASNGLNTAFIYYDLDAFILPANLLEFTVDVLYTNIQGTFAFTYTNFQIDYTNNSSFDDSSVTVPETFANTYTSDSTALIRYTIQIGVTSYNINNYVGVVLRDTTIDLVITPAQDCMYFDVYSETKNYLEKLIGRGDLDNSEMSALNINVKQNCCQEVEFKLAPVYKFDIEQLDCTHTTDTVVINGDTYFINNVTLEITGISQSLVETITVNGLPTTNQLDEIYFVSYRNQLFGGPIVTTTVTIVITTTEGFEYTIVVLSTPTNSDCNITNTITGITYPDYPCYASITTNPDNTTLTITSELFYGCDTTDAFMDGVYQITLNDSNISNEYITNCVYLDCETECKIIEAIASGCNPIILIIYNSLITANTCTNITCQNYCDMLEMLNAFMTECDCSLYTNNTLTDTGCKNCNKSNYKPCKSCK